MRRDCLLVPDSCKLQRSSVSRCPSDVHRKLIKALRSWISNDYGLINSTQISSSTVAMLGTLSLGWAWLQKWWCITKEVNTAQYFIWSLKEISWNRPTIWTGNWTFFFILLYFFSLLHSVLVYDKQVTVENKPWTMNHSCWLSSKCNMSAAQLPVIIHYLMQHLLHVLCLLSRETSSSTLSCFCSTEGWTAAL